MMNVQYPLTPSFELVHTGQGWHGPAFSNFGEQGSPPEQPGLEGAEHQVRLQQQPELILENQQLIDYWISNSNLLDRVPLFIYHLGCVLVNE